MLKSRFQFLSCTTTIKYSYWRYFSSGCNFFVHPSSHPPLSMLYHLNCLLLFLLHSRWFFLFRNINFCDTFKSLFSSPIPERLHSVPWTKIPMVYCEKMDYQKKWISITWIKCLSLQLRISEIISHENHWITRQQWKHFWVT